MAMVADSAMMCYLEGHSLAAHVVAMGEHLAEYLHILQRDYLWLGDIRDRGLTFRVEVVDLQGKADALGYPSTDGALTSRVQHGCLRHGLVLELGGRHNSVVRFLPPLVIGAEQIDEMARRFIRALSATLAG